MQEQFVLKETANSSSALKKAVYQNPAPSKQGSLERLFAFAFDNLVYPQIWEDPEVDMSALSIGPKDHIVTIASGGCNVLSYLSQNPARITAVDLNASHLALTDLKIKALMYLPSYEEFRQFFAESNQPGNMELYRRYLEPYLDQFARNYWSKKTITGSPRIKQFTSNFYHHGLLGKFIGFAHVISRIYGVDPSKIMNAHSVGQQKEFFENELAPLFDKRAIRWLTSSPISLYGLGIPPAQYVQLSEGQPMADVLRKRLENLACNFPLAYNYFARQAFARTYCAENRENTLPPYLEEKNWQTLKKNSNRVSLSNQSITTFFQNSPANNIDCIVLLDAQDWMNDSQMNELWAALSHAAAPGARVIFRTAAKQSPLESRLRPSLLQKWTYERERSQTYSQQDRSAIYGGFHLYKCTA